MERLERLKFFKIIVFGSAMTRQLHILIILICFYINYIVFINQASLCRTEDLQNNIERNSQKEELLKRK